MNWVIETENLGKQFGNFNAVKDLNLRIPQQGIYGFLGENGAGKTTTFKLLLGLQKPSMGQIKILGQPLQGNHKVMRRVGALIENPSLYGHLTGEEHLRMLCWMRGLPKSCIGEALAQVGLLDRAKQRSAHYSHGMKQRLGIAMALLGNPELILLDEPTNGLDPSGIRDMRQLIAGLPQRTGATVFVSSHMLGEVEKVADELVILKRGRSLFQGPLSALRAKAKATILLRSPHILPAEAVLKEWQPQRLSEDRLLLAGDETEVPEINRRLVAAKIEVSSLHSQQADLEEVYFQMMKEPPCT